jgi:hypothetical protein
MAVKRIFFFMVYHGNYFNCSTFFFFFFLVYYFFLVFIHFTHVSGLTNESVKFIGPYGISLRDSTIALVKHSKMKLHAKNMFITCFTCNYVDLLCKK